MSLSVLIVDESPVMRQVIERLLTISKLPIDEFVPADDGKAALAVLRSRKIDLILTDTQMAPMSGEEFADCLHKDATLRELPLLVISADQTAGTVQHMLDRGASCYLPKPLSPALLRSEITRVLP